MSRDKERRDANPYKVIKLKTKRQNYVYWVFEDPDFKKDVIILREWFDKTPKKLNHDDVEARKDVMNSLSERKALICKKYGLSEYELSIYYHSLQKWHLFNSKLLDIRISEIDDYSVSIRLLPDITYDEYVDIWGEVRDYIKDEYPKRELSVNKTKRKQEVDYQLVYAVDKAKRNNITDIFNHYKAGKLPCYEGRDVSRFDIEKELNDYYQLNKVTPN